MSALDSNDENPLYKQLYHQIREHALSGKLPADFKLRIPTIKCTGINGDFLSQSTYPRNFMELFP